MPTYLTLIVLTFTACATKAPGQNYRLSDNGYATVLSAPHSKLSKQVREELEVRMTSPTFKIPLAYSQLREEAEQLRDTLREKESDNFTEFRYEWEPEFRHLFSFKRDPEKTLAKYTSNPNFKAGIQRHSKSYLEGKNEEVWEFLAPGGRIVSLDVISPSGQINMMKGVVEISTGAYEDKFFAIPGAENFRNDPDIEFTFLERRSPDTIIDPRVAPHIKLFLRDDIGGEQVVVGSTTATIQLRDGCFFAKEKKSLILFPESSNLGLDDDGYIIIYNDRDYIARVGEKMRFWNGFRAVEDARYTGPLQEACGQFPVVKINDPRSEYVSRKTAR